jgi:aspartate ammonia-lyase
MANAEQHRVEKDIVGEVHLARESLTGIHTARATENFALAGGPVNERLIRAYGLVKLACARTNVSLGYLTEDIGRAIESACEELSQGELTGEVRISALQGGAGTSTNMYVNELITNRALLVMGKEAGDYQTISPLDHVNKHQSTNDTYPTALRVAAMKACDELERTVSELADAFQKKEKEFAGIVKLGRTELQDAVLMTLGQEMGCYAEAFSRDRWRIYKCKERLRVVNLGGTAIGTGICAPQKFIFMATDVLREIAALPLARADNLVQATQNVDDIVEVSGILKALATNIFKVTSDLRLLSSGPVGGLGEISLPMRQAGSSIMPGKVNPVIAEFAGQLAIQAISHDAAITMAAMNGQLELNAFMPCIAHNLLGMLDELIVATDHMRRLMVTGITAHEGKCATYVHSSTAILSALVGKVGYARVAEAAAKAEREKRNVEEVVLEEGLCTEGEYEWLTSAEAVTSLGFRENGRSEKGCES